MSDELASERSDEAAPTRPDESARFEFGIDEIRRFADASDLALSALAGLPERLRVWGHPSSYSDTIVDNWSLVLDQLKPFFELVKLAQSFGIPFPFDKRFFVCPKPELYPLISNPPDVSAVKKHAQIFVDLHKVLFSTIFALDAKIQRFPEAVRATFPPEIQLARLGDVTSRLRELRERVNARINSDLHFAKTDSCQMRKFSLGFQVSPDFLIG